MLAVPASFGRFGWLANACRRSSWTRSPLAVRSNAFVFRSYLPEAMRCPALKFRSTLSTATDEPVKVACAVKPCKGSPARRPCDERMSATPVIASGIPLIFTVPETSPWVSPSCSRVCGAKGSAAIKLPRFIRSRVASIEALFSPVRGTTSENCAPPPVVCASRPSVTRVSVAFDEMFAVSDPSSRLLTLNEPSSACPFTTGSFIFPVSDPLNASLPPRSIP